MAWLDAQPIIAGGLVLVAIFVCGALERGQQ